MSLICPCFSFRLGIRALLGGFIGLALSGSVSRGAEPATWPQWRGPNRDCASSGAAFPDKLDGLKQAWRVELGPGYSGPVVLADRVIVTETVDEKFEVVRALDRATGKELWTARWEGGQSVIDLGKPRGEWIRATPASDGKSVYVAGMRDLLVCLDASDGKERWRVDFVKEFNSALPMFGMVSSPQIDGDAVYTLAATGVVRVNAKTGKVEWRTLTDGPKEEGGATSSVLVTNVAGRKMVVALNRKTLALLDPETGKILWKQATPAYRNTTTLTPVILGESALFISMIAGRSMRFDVSIDGDKVAAKRTWDVSQVSYMSTPVRVGDYLYAHLETRRFACLDLKTGRAKWTSDQSFGEYWSMVVRGDRILALDQKGTLYLVRATPEKFDLIDQRKISDADTWAHLAVCGDEVFVRDLKGIVVYHWNGK
ncbi:PQQ-binding-like beta-propeller repeat protein [Zavarzinella formosa]|uniref:PQQ-binding-like beta-propeller repeat protein n=1 Tax=Zavarzinella formosa TaxID=360055 RepID=UPI000313B464|nr:PQQ-binding-like beta-propeller repeat protein [Zavarzinella formosa]